MEGSKIRHGRVHPGQMLGDTALPSITGFRLKPIDEIDDVVKATAGPIADTACGDRDGQMGCAGTGAANQDDMALLALNPSPARSLS
jgi:hypothetical protein